MVKVNFKLWIERNVFGFDDEIRHQSAPYHPSKVPLKGPQDLPVERLNTFRLIELLAKNNLGVKVGKSKFFNECQWGENAGAIRTIITPKLNVKIQKLHYDLEGNQIWLMKKYFFIDDGNYAGKEDVVALEIFDQVKNINDEQLESASKNIKIQELVEALSSKLNTLESSTLLPSHQVKKVSENEYVLYYYLRGAGASRYVGARGSSNVMEVVVNLSRNVFTGLIRTIVSIVNTEQEGTSWQLQPADFNEFFMPTQGKKEIIESIMTALKTY